MTNHNFIFMSCNIRSPLKKTKRSTSKPKWLNLDKAKDMIANAAHETRLYASGYTFSSSFNNLFGKWTWWKILLYIGFSFIICLIVLFAKVWECSTSPRAEAHMAFFILMITSVYAFFLGAVRLGVWFCAWLRTTIAILCIILFLVSLPWQYSLQINLRLYHSQYLAFFLFL